MNMPAKTRFFAVWKKYCQEARIPKDEQNDARRELISEFYPEKKSFTELTATQINYLADKVSEKIEPADMPDEAKQDGDRMRKKIIAILIQLYDFKKISQGRFIPDMTRINAFLKEKTAFKCDLNALTIDQLPKVVTQVMQLQKKQQEKNRKEMTVVGGKNI